MVILDTNIIIDHLRSKGKKESVLMDIIQKYPKEMLGISVISIQELFEWKSTKKVCNKIFIYFLRVV